MARLLKLTQELHDETVNLSGNQSADRQAILEDLVMTCPALKFDDPSASAADHGVADASTASDAKPARESLFETFVDEIDIWARRALAANGFGDY